MANAVTQTTAKVYFLTDGSVRDSYGESNFHPLSNMNMIEVYIEDGDYQNVVTINYAPPIRKNWATHWFPCFYRDLVEHTLDGESTPRTFAQYITWCPNILLAMNQNGASAMNVITTVQQQSGLNLIGSYATVGELPTSYDTWADLQDLEEANAIAYVWENGLNGFYHVVYTAGDPTGTYAWTLVATSIQNELSTKQYNAWTITVQRGYGNPLPITNIADEQYRLIWQEFNELASLIATNTADITALTDRVLALEEDVADILDGTLDIAYNNAISGLIATTIKTAIDEVAVKVTNMLDGTQSFTAVTLYSADGLAVATFNGVDIVWTYRDVAAEMFKNLFVEVKASGAITNGDVIQYAGSVGASGVIYGKKAVQAEINANPHLIIGLATHDIANGSDGLINFYGAINGIDTTIYSGLAGSMLYFDSEGSTAGAMTSTKPTAPNVRVIMGLLTVKHATQGQIKIRPDFGRFLKDLHDVYYNGHVFTDDDILVYNVANARWQVTTKALFLAGCVQTDLNNTYTGIQTYQDGNYKVVLNDDGIEFYDTNVLFVKINSSGIYINPSIASGDNLATTRARVNALISAHNGTTDPISSHPYILALIQALQLEIDRLNAIGKSWGEVDYENATLVAMATDADRLTAIEDDIVSRYATYTHAINDFVYDKGLIVDGIPTNYHVWKYNGTIWADEGIESAISKASDLLFGIVRGGLAHASGLKYTEIISGEIHNILADKSFGVYDASTGLLHYTYEEIKALQDRIYASEQTIISHTSRLNILEPKVTTLQSEMIAEQAISADLQPRMDTAELDIDTLTDNIALIDDANLNESHSRMSPALLGTIIDGTPVSDAYWNGRLNEIRLKGLTVPQLIKNGNFVTTGNWTVGSLASFTVANNVATMLANNQYDYLSQVVNCAIGNVLYISFFINAPVGNSVGLLITGDGASTRFVTATGGQTISFIYTATATSHEIRVSDFRASGWTNILVSEAKAINLTALGTHPTLGVAWSTLSASVVASYIGNYKTNAEIVAESTNIVLNGEGSSTTSWSGSGGTVSASDGLLKITGTGSNAFALLYQDTASSPLPGKLWAYAIKLRVTNALATSIQIVLDGSTGGTDNVIHTITNPTINTWYEFIVSGLMPSDATGVVRVKCNTVYASTANATGAVTEFDYIRMYEITDSARTSGLYSFTPLAITSTDGTITRTLDLSSIGAMNSLPSGIKDEFDTYVDTTSGERVHEHTMRTKRINLPTTSGWTAGTVGASFSQFYIDLGTYDGGKTLTLPGDDTDLPDAFQSINYVPTAFIDFQTLDPEAPTVAGSCITPGGIYHIVLPNATADVIAELYTYLASNPISIIIAITETVETSVIGYLKQTGLPMTINVTSDTFVNESAFSVKYVKDTETIIDNRSDLIEADIEVAQADILNNELAIAVHEQRLDEAEETLRKNLSADGLATTDDDGMGVIALSKDVAPAPLKVQVDGLLLDAPQLLSNPTFDTVTTGWTATNIGTPSVSSGIVSFTATAQYGALLQALAFVTANKYYVIAKVKATTASVLLRISGNVTSSVIAHSGGGAYETISLIHTLTTDTSITTRIYDARTSAWDVIYADYVYGFNISTLISNKQYSPLYSTTFDLMSDAQIKAQMDSWVIDGTLPSSINAVNMNKRIRATGKNLFDKTRVNRGFYIDKNTGALGSGATYSSSDYIKVKPSTNYYQNKLSGSGTGEIAFYDINKVYISGVVWSGLYVCLTPANAYYLRTTMQTTDIDTFQFELGTAATAYAPYQDSDIYLQADTIGYSLPNLVKDSIEMRDGKAYYVKRIAKYTLVSGDITQLSTNLTNIDLVISTNPSGAYSAANSSIAEYKTFMVNWVEKGYLDNLANIGSYYKSAASQNYVFCVAKGTYATLALAQAALAGTVIYYQLATPITTEIKSSGILNGFPSGQIYVDDIIKDQDIYTTNIAVTNTNYPITSLDFIYRVNTMTSLAVSGATIASGGLSFTHSSLVAGDIVIFGYYYGDGLRGLTTVTYYPALEDLRFPVTVFKQGATIKPDFDYTNIGLLFPQNDATEIAYIVAQLPHDRIPDSDIVPHVHVRLTGANQPVMKMDYKWYNIDEAPATGFTTYIMNVNSSAWASGTKAVKIFGAAAISGVGKGDSSILIIKLYRDDNVYVGDLLVDEFDIHYYKSR